MKINIEKYSLGFKAGNSNPPNTPCYPMRGTKVKEEDITGA